MSGSADLSAALVAAEQALRAHGLTGAAAFDALLDGLEHQLGLAPAPPDSVAAVAATIPIHPGTDLFGLAYERFFPDLFKGLRGQFFTPPPLARLLWSRLPPAATVADPTCGSGGLLVGAAASGARAFGVEIDARLARLAALNLRLAGVHAEVACGDVFTADPVQVDVVIANPPFSVPITDRGRLDRFELGRGRARVSSDHLFL
ncbi:MAG: N-6 DNA methylase, partial [Myxococcota bacterium]